MSKESQFLYLLPMSFAKIMLAFCFLTLVSCSTVRKAHAGKILAHCQFSVNGWSLDSIAVDAELFPKSMGAGGSPFPNPQILGIAQDLMKGKASRKLGSAYVHANLMVQNNSQDSLWIHALKGTARFDSLLIVAWAAKADKVLGPGMNIVPLSFCLPLDSHLFHVLETDSLILSGGMLARLSNDGVDVPLEFRTSKATPKDEIKTFISNASNSILDAMLNGWAKSLN